MPSGTTEVFSGCVALSQIALFLRAPIDFGVTLMKTVSLLGLHLCLCAS